MPSSENRRRAGRPTPTRFATLRVRYCLLW